MEWLVGEHPKELLLVSSRKSVDRSPVYSGRQPLDAKKRLLDLVTKGVEASLTQLLETGLLHADPHPGNLRYTATGQIGFLDFGLICRMEKKHQFAMLSSIVHIVNGDWAGLVHDLTQMDVAKSGTSIHRLTLVLAKIWSVALKYHFRMPPYYMLVFRSLASLEGLAVAADQDFKTFDAAFPYVVRKLLTDNSAASRKILHSVVFNKRKEIQWQKLSLFLRMGVNIKGVQRFIASNFEASHENAPTVDSSKVANLVVRLLPSKDGMVLRRVLMTADEASLVQVMVSREAIVFRKQVTIALAYVLYQWMSQALGQSNDTSHLKSGVKMVSGLHHKDESPSSGISASVYDYHSVIKDRRLQLICRKVLDSARRQPLLMLKFSWASIVMFLSAFAFAFHKILVIWSDKCIASLSLAPRMIAFSS
ncbi:hypothetical protein IFM89_014476 [Coptis chinensis]|uniref:ABC1 atypical kinase-like domain-containing protein n=1 Tax=Coptis chinensis TaxID=261450 RepID=A0A835HEQ2_9MAGN|nr:hypothetical protein IFM89_014476 [Coptis chinensis]